MDVSLNQEIYEKLKNDIMKFELKPCDVISAQKIANRYSVSRTPAREAIITLEKENLLKIMPKSGTYVAKISMNRAKQEWRVRLNLEIGMVDGFFDNVNDKTISQMEKFNDRIIHYDASKEKLARIEIDNMFHQLIYDCSGEELSAEIIKTQMSHYNRMRYLSELSNEIKTKTNTEHIAIIEATKNKDKKLYLDIITKHINRIFREEDDLKEKYPEYFD